VRVVCGVFLELCCVLTNVSEIHRLSTLGEKEQTVKLEEELGTRLMDGDEDGLTNIWSDTARDSLS
ncbi:unnamed protein product, partial [Sphagnum balticum]